jgi:hypothetical protein
MCWFQLHRTAHGDLSLMGSTQCGAEAEGGLAHRRRRSSSASVVEAMRCAWRAECMGGGVYVSRKVSLAASSRILRPCMYSVTNTCQSDETSCESSR